MARVVVVIVGSLIFMSGLFQSPAESSSCCPPPPPPCIQQCLITKMIPCVRTEMVAEVQPCTRTVPVTKVGYRTQKIMLKGSPVGQPCGIDPCTKCCPQPFCQVVSQKVPYYYCEYRKVPSYNIVYKPVCRTVMMPQLYNVQAIPLCK
jgi:hypothetical protein